jgi:1,4-alpha-glucan branching enzyme
MTQGYFCLVLHSHIPYTKKAGKWPFGEEWLYEAMAETYVPVLDILADLAKGTMRPRVCVSISPVLLEQLSDPYMNEGFEDYIHRRRAAAEADVERFGSTCDHKLKRLAESYVQFYERISDSYTRVWHRDLVGAFRQLQDGGCIETITSAATHAYLPLMADGTSIRMQLEVGREIHRTHMGREPKGIWLPECGYRPRTRDQESHAQCQRGIEQYVEDLGFRYFLVDSHAIEGGVPLGIYSAQPPGVPGETDVDDRTMTGKTTFRPYYVENSSVVVFGRDRRTSSQVWSSEWGYPGDGSYREFHKRDDESGLRYWRVTSRLTGLDQKELYNYENAMARVDEQSDHFVRLVRDLLSGFSASSQTPGILVAPYDIEFFGHWWHEGPEWLRQTLAKLSSVPEIEVTTPLEYLEEHPPTEVVRLRESSWGIGGRHYTWMNDATAWLWSDLASAESRLLSAIQSYRESGSLDSRMTRLLDQGVRELMLMQSSDWPFLITTGQAASYARSRFVEHRDRLDRILAAAQALAAGQGSSEHLEYLETIEKTDSLFSGMNLLALLS